MKRLYRLFLTIFCMAAFLTGCDTLGLQKPTSPEDGYRYAQSMMAGVYTTLGNAATDGSLPPADARKYHDKMEQPYKDMQLIEGAVRSSGGQIPADMQGKLTLAITVMNDVATELKKRLPPATTSALPAIKPAT